MTLEHLALEHGRRTHRHQPDERPDLELEAGTVGHPHHVVVEAILLVPQVRVAVWRVHRDRDPCEMGDKLEGHVEVHRIVLGELGRDLEHPLAVERHPGGSVGLLESAAPGQRRRSIEDPDVVEAEESALEQVAVVWILAVDPPGEVRQQPVEHAGEKLVVALAADLGLALVHE